MTFSREDCHRILDEMRAHSRDYSDLFASLDRSLQPGIIADQIRSSVSAEAPYFFGTLASGVKFAGDLRDFASVLHQLYPDCNANLIRAINADLAGRSGTIIDAGANIGVVSASVALANKDHITVHAFEPSPETARLAAATLALNEIDNVVLTQCAISDVNALIDFESTPGNSAIASTARHDFAYLNDWKTIAVRARTIDRIVHERMIGDLLLVKIDVEGHELAVLRGARGTMQQQSPMLIYEFTPLVAADDPGLAQRTIDLIRAVAPYQFEALIEPVFEGWGSPNRVVSFPLPEGVTDQVNVFARSSPQ